jgi:hypothetical protein
MTRHKFGVVLVVVEVDIVVTASKWCVIATIATGRHDDDKIFSTMTGSFDMKMVAFGTFVRLQLSINCASLLGVLTQKWLQIK